MENTLIVWRRTGKEHGEDSGFRANPPEVIATSLRHKAATFRQTGETDWSWWQFDDDLLVEKNLPDGDPNVLYYYLPKRHCVIVENATIRRLGPDWTWYVHIGDIEWDDSLGVWVFTDLFIDILVHRNCRTHTLVDMDDLAKAIDVGIVNQQESARILRHTQSLIDTIHSGDFPPREILPCRDALRRRGLVPQSKQTPG